jgi:hypothetical protein
MAIPYQLHGSTLQAEIDAVLGVGGIPVINHPGFDGLQADTILATTGVDHIEIANMVAPEFVAGDEALWDWVLSAGRILYGVASDDCHWASSDTEEQFGQGGFGWIVVRAPALTPSDIVDGIRMGRFYASTGIVLEDYRVDPASRTVFVASHNGGTISFIGRDGAVLATVLGNEAAFQLPGSEPYVRAKITNSSGQAAWTQPAFTAGP